MDFLPTAPSLVFARETYTPYSFSFRVQVACIQVTNVNKPLLSSFVFFTMANLFSFELYLHISFVELIMVIKVM